MIVEIRHQANVLWLACASKHRFLGSNESVSKADGTAGRGQTGVSREATLKARSCGIGPPPDTRDNHGSKPSK